MPAAGVAPAAAPSVFMSTLLTALAQLFFILVVAASVTAPAPSEGAFNGAD